MFHDSQPQYEVEAIDPLLEGSPFLQNLNKCISVEVLSHAAGNTPKLVLSNDGVRIGSTTHNSLRAEVTETSQFAAESPAANFKQQLELINTKAFEAWSTSIPFSSEDETERLFAGAMIILQQTDLSQVPQEYLEEVYASQDFPFSIQHLVDTMSDAPFGHKRSIERLISAAQLADPDLSLRSVPQFENSSVTDEEIQVAPKNRIEDIEGYALPVSSRQSRSR